MGRDDELRRIMTVVDLPFVFHAPCWLRMISHEHVVIRIQQ
jgi:hypothetical protein